jgi:hypothetical protein
MRQPCIGTFIVPVGDIRFEITERRKKTVSAMQKAVMDLEDIRDGKAVGPAYLHEDD